MPEELAGQIPGGGLLGGIVAGIGSALGGLVSGIGSAVSGIAGGVGSALSSIGNLFRKPREGGAKEIDPEQVRSQLGHGQPLDGGVKSRMESAFGHDFSRVRVHHDASAAELSASLNARAFTLGQHVAFGPGEYRPRTVSGDTLIAHELAHVVQQGSASGSFAGPSRSGLADSQALEDEADQSAVGATAFIWSGAAGNTNEVARKAKPRLRSAPSLRRCGGARPEVKAEKKDTALSKEEAEHARFRSAKQLERDKDIKDAGDLIRGANAWASAQVQEQHIPDITVPKETAVIGLDPAQRDNLKKASEKMEARVSGFDTSAVEPVIAKISQAIKIAREARKYLGSDDQLNKLQMQHGFYQAADAADEATALLEKTADTFDGYKVSILLNGAASSIKDAIDGKGDIDSAIAKLVEANTELRAERDKQTKVPDTIGKIVFILRSFLAVNGAGAPPSPDEAKKFKNSLTAQLHEDFTAVFGKDEGFDLFKDYATILEHQITIREKMAAAGAPAKDAVPSKGDAESFFKALAKKPNGEVRSAYEEYAAAYFYHRGVASMDDLRLTSVDEIYARKVSITGTRPLVCSGYALLGASLLGLAGATLVRFIVAVRATDD
ncbi:MAG TPA: DUF4157 domain-containing protein, partial [Blastocatellia bacterium]|nr:DUF4157 domain-containing protein [Blastocatellia bacterium]